MFRFETLDVWQLARGLTVDVYKLTKSWPKSGVFGLTSQVRRSAVSVGANITGGSAAATVKDYRNYLDLARKVYLRQCRI